jgi:hypothetical protein
LKCGEERVAEKGVAVLEWDEGGRIDIDVNRITRN